MGENPVDMSTGTPIPDDDSSEHVPNNIPDEISGLPDPDSGSIYDYGYVDEQGEAPRKKKKHDEHQHSGRGCSRYSIWLVVGCMTLCCACCIAPICVFTAAAGGMAAIASNSEATVTDTQTLTVDPDSPVTLTIDNPVGSVVIERGPADDTVEVVSMRRAFGWNKTRAERELDNIDVAVDQPDTNDIRIDVTTTREQNGVWSNANNVEMTVRVPETIDLTIKNNLGSIIVRDVRVNSLDLRTTLGSIVFEGDINPGTTASYFIETSTGSVVVRLPTNTYTGIDARAGVGDVTVSNAFNNQSDVDQGQESGETWWTGTLGTGSGDPPVLRLRSNTGAITVEVR